MDFTPALHEITEPSGAAAARVRRPLTTVERYQSDQPLRTGENAHLWRHAALEGVEIFRGSYRKYQASRHFHTIPAIGVVARGAMTSFCRGATHTLPPRTVFLINPGEVHAPGPAIPDGWILRALYFEDSFYRRCVSNFGLRNMSFSQVFVKDEVLAESLLRLHRALDNAETQLALESDLAAVFAHLSERYACEAPVEPRIAGVQKRIDRVREYLHAHLSRNVTLDDLADLSGFSPYHLLRTFRSTVGLTPHGYLTQIRVEFAKQRLRTGNAISEVAIDAGFVDQSHFTRHFKRITGVTPGQYLARDLRAANSLCVNAKPSRSQVQLLRHASGVSPTL